MSGTAPGGVLVEIDRVVKEAAPERQEMSKKTSAAQVKINNKQRTIRFEPSSNDITLTGQVYRHQDGHVPA